MEVYELEFEKRGRTFTYMMIHLRKGLRPDDKHSVKNCVLGNEAARLSPAALELLIEAKNREIQAVRDAPPFPPWTTEWIRWRSKVRFNSMSLHINLDAKRRSKAIFARARAQIQFRSRHVLHRAQSLPHHPDRSQISRPQQP